MNPWTLYLKSIFSKSVYWRSKVKIDSHRCFSTLTVNKHNIRQKAIFFYVILVWSWRFIYIEKKQKFYFTFTKVLIYFFLALVKNQRFGQNKSRVSLKYLKWMRLRCILTMLPEKRLTLKLLIQSRFATPVRTKQETLW